jgi:hypothetical protein
LRIKGFWSCRKEKTCFEIPEAHGKYMHRRCLQHSCRPALLYALIRYDAEKTHLGEGTTYFRQRLLEKVKSEKEY